MTKETKDRLLFELLYDLTQKNITVEFCKDYEGMITIGVYGKDISSHQHIGIPHQNDDISKQVRSYLSEFLEEQK